MTGGIKDTLLVTGATEYLMQEELPGVTTLVDARNGFNKMIRLVIPCTVIHLWLPGVGGGGVAFNGYKHWTQLLLLWLEKAHIVILRREGVRQGDLLSMVLYEITLVPSWRISERQILNYSCRSMQTMMCLMDWRNGA